MDIGYLAQLIAQHRFWALLPIACVSGGPFGFVVGTLVALGYLTLAEAALILVLGDLIPDTLYYAIGRFGRRSKLLARYGARIGVTAERLDALSRVWRAHTGKMMWIAKLASGFSHWFLISAGMSKISLKRYYFFSLPVTITQYTVTLTLGYYLGNAFYPLIVKSASGLGIVVVGIVAVIALYYQLTQFMRKKAMRIQEEETRK